MSIRTIRLPAWPRLRRNPRAKTPTLLQMEAVECGAAALAIVLAYYGRYVPLEELRIAAGVSRDGSKASNILRAARSYGCKATGFKKSLTTLRSVPTPAIIFWNFNHFVVFEGFGTDCAYINDPASGPRRVPMDEFDGSFTGITLVITPDTAFTRGGKQPSLLLALARRLAHSQTGVAYVLLASLLVTLIGIVVPSLTRMFIDTVLVEQVPGFAVPIVGALGLVAVALAALTWLQQRAMVYLEIKIAIAQSSRLFWHILNLPIEFFQQRRAADVSVRVNSNDRIAQMLASVVTANIINIMLIVVYVVVMIRYDIGLTLLGVAIASLNLLLVQAAARRQVDSTQRLLNEQGKFMATALGGLQMIETLKAIGGESGFFSRWSGYQANVLNAEQESGAIRETMTALPGTLAMLNTTALIIFGSAGVIQGRLSLGEFMAFQALMAAFLAPVSQFVSFGQRIQQTQADMRRLDDVLNYPAAAIPEETPMDQVTKLTGHIEVRDLTFGYSKLEKPLINNLSFSIAPGSRVAVVGGSGSGKSTVAKLVSGMYTPWSGEILFDGMTRDAIGVAGMRGSMAVVDQEIYLFAGSVRDNITMWNPVIPESHLLSAARDALVHADIAGRTGGYDAQVLEGGANFSGGQRQRMEIARALATSPSILVMDEATSALDPLTEQQIDDNIRRRGCTCLIVAHRLSTIRDCDEILVLERGQVVERGTHESLMRRQGGVYARLIRAEDTLAGSSGRIVDLL